MTPSTEISAKLFVVLGAGHAGPIDLNVRSDGKPEDLLSDQLDDALALPPDMRTPGPKHFYMPSGGSTDRLNPAATWKHHRLSQGDHVILSDSSDAEQLFGVYLTMCKLRGVVPQHLKPRNETRMKSATRKALRGIPYVGPTLEILIFGKEPPS